MTSNVRKSSRIRLSKRSAVYQFRVAVAGFDPPIWRRVQVRDCLLDELHAVFEVVMGRKQSPDFVFEGGLSGEHPVSGRPWIPHPSLPLSEILPVDRLPFIFF
jgi:hypothetical protein